MGNASAHEPLDRGTTFARSSHAGHKQSKRYQVGMTPRRNDHNADQVEKGQGDKTRSPSRRMDRLRRSFRDSFRRRKEPAVPESSKPYQWQADEAAVRAGTCHFHVKYMGCVEVFESRGMQVCEEALKVLRNSRRRRVKAILYVSGDGLRVVEEETKGLIVDQTIEKVSFCAPDRNHDKGFSYICRDGTTRRWMCHGFLALKESGERLSHAVGCAFAACLERKQRRDKECGVTMTFDHKNSTFTRSGSFRQASLTERLADPQDLKPSVPFPWEGAITNQSALAPASSAAPIGSLDPVSGPPVGTPAGSSTDVGPAPVIPRANQSPATGPDPVPPAPAHKAGNPYAIERPHATVSMLQRQGSFRGFSQLNQASPFKRQLSLRIGDLPSNIERQRSLSLEPSDTGRLPISSALKPAEEASNVRMRDHINSNAGFVRQRHMSLPDPSALQKEVSPIPEVSPLNDRVADPVTMMCQQLTQGLSLLSSDNFQLDSLSSSSISKQTYSTNNNVSKITPTVASVTTRTPPNVVPQLDPKVDPLAWTSTALWPRSDSVVESSPPESPSVTPVSVRDLPDPDQWLGKIATTVAPSDPPRVSPIPVAAPSRAHPPSPVPAHPPPPVPAHPPPPVPAHPPPPVPSPRRAPSFNQHTRAYSLGSAETYMGRMNANGRHPSDPFDAEWAAIATRNGHDSDTGSTGSSTNPFLGSSTVKAFEVRM